MSIIIDAPFKLTRILSKKIKNFNNTLYSFSRLTNQIYVYQKKSKKNGHVINQLANSLRIIINE